MKGQRLQVVDKFTYIGSILSRVVHIDDEVNARIAKASAAFGRLRGSVWDRWNLCVLAYRDGKLRSLNLDKAYIINGFSNWKERLCIFKKT